MWIKPIPKLAVHACNDRRMTSQEGKPCPACGHAPQVHAEPDGRELSVCAASIYEEDEGLRDVEAMCTRVFRRCRWRRARPKADTQGQ